MPRVRHLASLALTAALLLPGVAAAAPRTQAKAPTSASVIRAALAVSTTYWGAQPCGGRVTIATGRTPSAGMAADSDAWVTFHSSLGDNMLAAPASSYSKCTIRYSAWRWPSAASMVEDWPLVCATTIHEIGHLLGKPHDLTPGSVMTPVFTQVAGLPAICRGPRPAL